MATVVGVVVVMVVRSVPTVVVMATMGVGTDGSGTSLVAGGLVTLARADPEPEVARPADPPFKGRISGGGGGPDPP